jgi:Tol biopolymer transport system component
MTLAPRTRLGPYEIVGALAAGGMGEVYRARDTRLDRTVAIKVLHADLARDPALRQRFEREARAISSLAHPGICALYDVGQHDGLDFLVLELVEGETLAERLQRGALPLPEALRITIALCEALDAAHRSGLVHRDFKPANVMLTGRGIKLLDFGLAKRSGITSGASGPLDSALTEEGTLLGTLQYMSPEQLHGREADARSDLFALGATLYEMLTGQRAFSGASRASLIAAIVGSEPRALSELQPLTPPALDRALRRCLAKDPDERWQNARDLMHELQWIASGPEPVLAAGRAPAGRGGWIAAGLLGALLLAGGGAWWTTRGATPASLRRLAIALPASHSVVFIDNFVLSPDGRTLACVGYEIGQPSRLLLRALDDEMPHPLAGTEGGDQPFWSPDGHSIGFFADGHLDRVPAAGGPVQVLCRATAPCGGAWTTGGIIIFGGLDEGTPISRVAETGGEPVAVTRRLPSEEAHRWPSFLPDGRHFVYLADAAKTADHHLKIGSLDSPESTDLMQAISNARYVAPGWLLYVRSGSLLAQRFDAGALRLSGEPVPVAQHLSQDLENHHFEFCASGEALVYRSVDERVRLAWMDSKQQLSWITPEAGRFGGVRLSPDGRQVAYSDIDADGRPGDLWTLDLQRGVRTRITSDPAVDATPVWSPSGDSLAFASYRSGGGDIYVAPVSGSGEARLLLGSPLAKYPGCWSPDGRELLYGVDSPATSGDIWAVDPAHPQDAHAVITGPSAEFDPSGSPDGRWLAWTSDETGRNEIYVQLRLGGRRWRVSADGGWNARWMPDSSALLFQSPGSILMSAATRAGDAPEVGAPQVLFDLHGGSLCDVGADGRFLVQMPLEDGINTPLSVVLGWTSLLPSR